MYENIRTYQQAQEIWDGVDLMTEEGKPLSKYIEEGKLEEKLNTARNLKSAGVHLNIIAQATGLTLKEIEVL